MQYRTGYELEVNLSKQAEIRAEFERAAGRKGLKATSETNSSRPGVASLVKRIALVMLVLFIVLMGLLLTVSSSAAAYDTHTLVSHNRFVMEWLAGVEWKL